MRFQRAFLAIAFLIVTSLHWAPTSWAAEVGLATGRWHGADRYATAVAIASDNEDGPTGWQGRIAVLTRGDVFSDGLTAAYYAGLHRAPILLTEPRRLPRVVEDYLLDHRISRIVVVGGESAVSQRVLDRLEDVGIEATRVGGADRYTTAALLARSPVPTAESSLVEQSGAGELPTAIMASGKNFPDALVAGTASAAQRLPLLLTDPQGLPSSTRSAIRALGIRRVLLAGGPAAVRPTVESQLVQAGVEVLRLGGVDRQDTARVWARYGRESFGWHLDRFYLINGTDFPDALAAAARAGQEEGGPVPMLLTAGTSLGKATERLLREQASCQFARLDIAGGTRAVPQRLVDNARSALRPVNGCPSDSTAPTVELATSSVTALDGFITIRGQVRDAGSGALRLFVTTDEETRLARLSRGPDPRSFEVTLPASDTGNRRVHLRVSDRAGNVRNVTSSIEVRGAEPKRGPAPAVDLAGSDLVGKWLNLYNIATEKCLDLPGFGAGTPDGPVFQYACRYGEDDNQRWRFEQRGNVVGQDTYVVRNKADGRCLTPATPSPIRAGTRVVESVCPEDATALDQEFLAPANESHSGLTLIHRVSGLCLDVSGPADGGDDAPITLATCSRVDDHAWSPQVSGLDDAVDAPDYRQAYAGAFGPPRPKDTALAAPLPAPSTPDDGLVVARFYIPGGLAGARTLEGDNRGPSAAPDAPSRVTVAWDVRRGKLQLIAHPTRVNVPGLPGVDLLPPLDPIIGGQPWTSYPTAAEALSHPDGEPLTHNKFHVSQGASGPTAWVEVSSTAVNSATARVRGGAWSVNGTLRLSRNGSGGYDVAWHGTGYPAQEVYYYPRLAVGPTHLIALQSIDPQGLTGLDAALEPSGGAAAAFRNWANCRMPNRYSMSCSSDVTTCDEWVTSWDPRGDVITRPLRQAQPPRPSSMPVRGVGGETPAPVVVTRVPSPSPGTPPGPVGPRMRAGCVGLLRSVNIDGSIVGAASDAVARIHPRNTVSNLSSFRWRVVPGLADSSGISLESMSRPGYYLRHRDYQLVLERFDENPPFMEDATFYVEDPGPVGGVISLRSRNFPDRYVRHYLGDLEVSSRDFRPGTPFDADRNFLWDPIR